MRKLSKMVARAELTASQQHANRLDAALHATMNDLVTWGSWTRETDGTGKYRVGITHSECWPVAILVFRCPGNGSDSVQAFDYEPWADSIRDMRSRGFYADVYDAMNDAAEVWRNRKVSTGVAA